ncbi:MAG: methyltransferase domain-containing protein [Phycisphaeraceae bacterium]|nr:methyltransferase domain-containing protein [Phycisphaeraceae bacterium]
MFEDADLIIVEKPEGMLTAGTPGENRTTLFDLIKRHVRRASPPPRDRRTARDLAAARGQDRPGRSPVGVVHRLDKEASGLVLFSKTEKAYTWLKDDFKAKRVHRLYLALVEGEIGPVGHNGTIQSFLKEDRSGKVFSIRPDEFRGSLRPGKDDEDAARPAVTHYRVLAVRDGRSLLQVRLDTGRKHQIRVHLSEHGHPICGDSRYGAKTDPLGRVCLHAAELGLTHPGTGQKGRWTSAAPAGMYTLVGMQPPMTAPAAPQIESPRPERPDRLDTSWQPVANWYDAMIGGEAPNDHYENVIIPGTIRLLGPTTGMRLLDVACGQGVISRAAAALGADVVGVDAAEDLIKAAQQRGKGPRYLVGDARELDRLGLEGPFDAATCVMALTNIEPLEPVFTSLSRLIRPGGGLVFVISHPAFRAPGQTSWGWDDKGRRQFRRVDGYLSNGQHRIQMHPGENPDVVTWTFHRPLQTYARLLRDAGFAIETLEEWPGQRTSQPGPRAEEENRARREIPLFLGVRAVRLPQSAAV